MFCPLHFQVSDISVFLQGRVNKLSLLQTGATLSRCTRFIKRKNPTQLLIFMNKSPVPLAVILHTTCGKEQLQELWYFKIIALCTSMMLWAVQGQLVCFVCPWALSFRFSVFLDFKYQESIKFKIVSEVIVDFTAKLCEVKIYLYWQFYLLNCNSI